MGPIQLVADCQSVVTSAARGHLYAAGPHRPQGGIWRDVHAAKLDKRLSRCIKVRAHTNFADATGIQLTMAQGNDLADRHARLGAGLHDAVDAEAAELAAAWGELRLIVRVTGAALA